MRVLSAIVLASVLVPAAPVRADTIHITSGAWQWSGSLAGGDLTMSGKNFTFSGFTHQPGVFWPHLQCFVPDCHPGTTVKLDAHWDGVDVPGTATIDGTTVPIGAGMQWDDAGLFLDWKGSLTIPLTFTGGDLSAPFSFAGTLRVPQTPEFTRLYTLTGFGTATITLMPSAIFGGALILEDARYEFSDTAPTPEPASMLLIGTGLAGLAAVRRRRRDG